MAEGLLKLGAAQGRVLLPRAREAREVLPDTLRRAGAEVDVVPVYETVPAQGDKDEILRLLAEGRLVNLASGNGHPAEIMDTSFSVQALALEYLLHHASELGRQVYDIPEEIDREVSRLKLHGAGLRIDTLTPEQEAYLSGWQV